MRVVAVLVVFMVGCTSSEITSLPSKTIKPTSLSSIRKRCRLWLIENDYPLLVDNDYRVKGRRTSGEVEFTFYPHKDSLEITMSGSSAPFSFLSSGAPDYKPATSKLQLERFQSILDTLFIGIGE